MAYTGIPLNQKGAANGVASLDASGKVPAGQLSGGGDAILLGSYGAYVSEPLGAYGSHTLPIAIALPTLAVGNAIYMATATSAWSSGTFVEMYEAGMVLHYNEGSEHTSEAIWTKMGTDEWMLLVRGGTGDAQQYVGWVNTLNLELWFINNLDQPVAWEGTYGINVFAVKG